MPHSVCSGNHREHRRGAAAGTGLRRFAVLPIILIALALGAPGVAAQVSELEPLCTSAPVLPATCAIATDIAEIAGARVLLLGTGASPVPSTASTLGHRMPGTPHWVFAGRVTSAHIALPDSRLTGSSISGTGVGMNLDIAIGLFDGFPAFATVGGLASLDLLASVGTLRLPQEAGFRTRSPVTGSLGARLGILRESFTVPGISVSAMYRKLGKFSAGGPIDETRVAHVHVISAGAWSLRASTGKRFAGIDLTAGLGWDRIAEGLVLSLTGTGSTSVKIRTDSYTSSRTVYYGGLKWTRLIYSLSGEFGWQRGANLEDGRTPASDARGSGAFVSLAASVIL